MMIPMRALVHYLTHPQVQIDPAVAVPAWGLSEIGRARVAALVAASWLTAVTQVVASSERKAIETAQPIAAALGLKLEIREAMGENDRSATGFLAPAEFETVANRFFAMPALSVRGWERAVDAQTRIVAEAEQVLGRERAGDVLLVGHGAVGTLLYCHYAGLAISRQHDQPAGGGCYFSFRKQARAVLHAWRPMEIAPLER